MFKLFQIIKAYTIKNDISEKKFSHLSVTDIQYHTFLLRRFFP